VLKKIEQHLANVYKHLYINPLERCNLHCKICYTSKTKFVLSNKEIISFLDRYQKVQELESVTFCGGEVFLLKNFTQLVNDLTKKGIFVQIISNGTIDRLDEIKQTNMVNLIVSLDGIESYHDKNRGEGNFAKSVKLLRKADRLGFHTEVFSIVTKQNLPLIEQFENDLQKQLNKKEKISITYHPRKPRTYLKKHPISNVLGQTKGFDFLSLAEIRQLMQDKQTFPPKDFGCYQISLMSNGKIYGCCEGINPIGNINSDIAILIDNLKKRLNYLDHTKHNKNCLGCVEHEFNCGLKPIAQKTE